MVFFVDWLVCEMVRDLDGGGESDAFAASGAERDIDDDTGGTRAVGLVANVDRDGHPRLVQYPRAQLGTSTANGQRTLVTVRGTCAVYGHQECADEGNDAAQGARRVGAEVMPER